VGPGWQWEKRGKRWRVGPWKGNRPSEAGRRPGEAARAGKKGGRAGLGWKRGRVRLGVCFVLSFFFKPFLNLNIFKILKQTLKLLKLHTNTLKHHANKR
jgi:hypothetical protein